MTEEEAQFWLADRVPRETVAKVARYVDILREGAKRQNLVAKSTLPTIWARHIVDSAQLLETAPAGPWVDVGSGAGLPGLVIALCDPDRQVLLVEPRRLRVEFLSTVVADLDLAGRVDVHATSIGKFALPAPPAVISARAFANLTETFASAAHIAGDETVWLLPKGQGAQREVAEASTTWQGSLRIVPSVTSPESSIVVARDVRRRKR